MKTTLLIMAAGIGSRFGTGIKQLEPVDDANHIIMDYAFQNINNILGELPEGRTKPWGTGSAVLAAKNVSKEPLKHKTDEEIVDADIAQQMEEK